MTFPKFEETSATLARHGNSTALPLNKDTLRTVGLSQGDDVTVTVDRATGTLTVRKADTDYARAMEIGRRAMVRYRRTFELLAK